MADQRLRGLFDDTDIRLVLVQLEESSRDALAPHPHPPATRQLLGQFMAAVAAMAATLKLEGSLMLQAQGEGPLKLAMAECTSAGAVRAIAHGSEPQGVDDLLQLVLPGHLALTIEPTGGQRYQGIVPLDGPDLARCLEHYFHQSEQLATAIHLASDGQRASALLLQELPASGRDLEQRRAQWQHLSTLAATVTPAELLELPAETLLHRLFHQEALRLLGTDPLHFACSCSQARTEAMLRSLGRDEVFGTLAEQGQLTVRCEFCNQIRTFNAEDIAQLFPGPTGTH